MTYSDTRKMFLLKLTSKNFMPGLTIAAMAAADGHMESNCSSVREGTPGAEHT